MTTVSTKVELLLVSLLQNLSRGRITTGATCIFHGGKSLGRYACMLIGDITSPC